MTPETSTNPMVARYALRDAMRREAERKSASGTENAEIARLKARLAELEAENAALKAATGETAQDTNPTPAAPEEATHPKKSGKKASR